MPRTKKQFESMREKSRRSIMDSAIKLFATQGYHTTTMEGIAREANISKGLIYNYFSSKETLLSEVIHEGLSVIESLADRNTEISAKERLKNEIEVIFFSLDSNYEYWKFFSQILFQPEISELYRKDLEKVFMEQIDCLTSIFIEMKDPAPRLKALSIGATLDGIGFHLAIDPDYPLNEMKNYLIKQFCTKGNIQ
ncbi:MAG: TetR/AcrR family transcriptional regulator [Candidatus Marinimicrobia bacterium]|jgi:AcrR family transcriptional regulator|nr:TetR/AcrR family transcriptional regulator [Candidatus Neomarinimicrobiota bacterium]MBT3633451.1 TetR/AcrR family transcriptional regulator [Candidatus Neomarinimicrobiota bacterium]MBT3681594.1 TetR/AcrR family transcriptional regulator [Candidatus Neomarinimicrobiota bacterium]MBT3758439.1 TetR/AcrR family transcriptional regulator [Candidatus Neomarinimicrobiota bacterium]MBT3894907.1 TetR/AcrR family transcriptional regulator [Candidatus Neomarinimicrobiota bacterium]